MGFVCFGDLLVVLFDVCLLVLGWLRVVYLLMVVSASVLVGWYLV